MRPAPLRVLGSIRRLSTTVPRPNDSLAATFGKPSKAQQRANQSGIGGLSSQQQQARSNSSPSYGRDDDEDATQADSAVGEEAQSQTILPIFKYHGYWGKPKTPSIRHLKMPYSPWLWNGQPFRALTSAQRKKGGRDQSGQIVRHHIGGGFKRRHRKLDFMRLEEGPQDVVRIEFDPLRSCHIALLRNRTGLGEDGGWSYIIAPDGCRAGDVLTSYRKGVPKGLVPQWDAEVARFDEDSVARDQALAAKQAARVKYLEEGFRNMALEGSNAPLTKAQQQYFPTESTKGIEAPVAVAEDPFTAVTVDEQHQQEYVSASSRSSAPSSSSSAVPRQRSFSTSTPSPSSSTAGSRSFSSTPTVLSTEVEPTPSTEYPFAPPKPASILPNKANPKWSQASAGINPSFALNLLRTLIVKPGNVVQLTLIPLNTPIHAITLSNEGRAVLCRSAGTMGTILSHQKADEKGNVFSFVKLQSGEVRKIPSDAYATIGQVSNKYHSQRNLGKAGRSRNLGIRPHVRGVAMNAFEHPHGGGRGKSKSNKHPRSRWGWLTRGVRTRKPGINGHKNGNKLVIKERPRGKATPATMEAKK